MNKNLFLISEEEKGRILSLHVSATKNQYLNVVSEQFDKTKGTYTIQKPQTLKASVDFTTKFPKTIPAGTIVFHDYNKSNNKIVLGNTGVVAYCNRNTFVYNDGIDDLKNDGLMSVLKGVFCNGSKLKTWNELTGSGVATTNNTNQSTNTTLVSSGGGGSNSIKLPNLTNKNFCTLPNDKVWKYAKMDDGTWYTSKDQENWFKLTLPKYQKAVDILSKDATCSGLEPIEKMETLKVDKVDIPKRELQIQTGSTIQSPTTTQQQSSDPYAKEKQTLPFIDKLDPAVAEEVIDWSKTPSGQYVINTPKDQRETALDNLDRRRGDETTRRLKKEIRIALGMAADTGLGRLGSAFRGGVEGFKQGFRTQQ